MFPRHFVVAVSINQRQVSVIELTVRLAVPYDTNFDSPSRADRIDVFRLRALSVLTLHR